MRVAIVGKGGVGKTTIAGTLARLLARRGRTWGELHRILALLHERAVQAQLQRWLDTHDADASATA